MMKSIFSKILLSLFFVLGIAVFATHATYAAFDVTDSIKLSAMPGSEVGSVFLSWNSPGQVNTYNVVYGTEPGVYKYGVTDIGYRASTTIGGLEPGKKYYFALSPVISGTAYDYTNEASSVAATKATVSTETEVTAARKEAIVSSLTSGPTNAPWYLHGKPGPSKGQVTLYWENNNTGYNGFDVVYGTKTGGSYVHGAQNVGNVSTYTVSGLASGVNYLFSILPEKDGQSDKENFANPIVVMAQ